MFCKIVFTFSKGHKELTVENLSINHLAVFVCALLNLALGALWYSPGLFYKAWRSETKLSEEELASSNPAKIYGLTLLLQSGVLFERRSDHPSVGSHGRFPGRLWLVHPELCNHCLVRAALMEVYPHQRRIHHPVLHTDWFHSWIMALERPFYSKEIIQ
jgi:hypothetical protein